MSDQPATGQAKHVIARDVRLLPVAGAAFTTAHVGVGLPRSITLAVCLGAILLMAGWALVVIRHSLRPHRGVNPAGHALATPGVGHTTRHGVLIWCGSATVGVALVAGALAVAHQDRHDSALLRQAADQPRFSAEVTISDWPQAFTVNGARRWRVAAAATPIPGRHTVDRESSATQRPSPVMLFGDDALATAIPGETYQATTTFKPTAAADADYAVATINPRRWEKTADAPPWWRFAAHTRAQFADICQHLPTEATMLLPGLVLGVENGISPELDDAMTNTGLSHLTAVSGSNIAIVCGLFVWLLSWVTNSLPVRYLSAAGFLVGYVAIVGPEPSVLRAWIMGTMVLAAIILARAAGGLPALNTAVVVLLVHDPWLSHRLGFQLSVVATLAIVVAAGPTQKVLKKRMPAVLATALAVSLVATVATSPLIAVAAGTVHPYAVLANVVVAPIIPIATLVGLVAAVCAVIHPGVATIVVQPAGYGAAAVAHTAHTINAWPRASIPVTDVAAFWPAVCVTALIAGLGCAAWAIRRRGITWQVGRWQLISLGVAALCCVVAVTATTPIRRHLPWGPGVTDDWLIAACDVGQGSAYVIRTSPQRGILIDTGEESAGVADCLHDLNVAALDVLVISHFHQDHAGAAPQLLATMPVAQLWTSPALAPPHLANSIVRQARDQHIPVITPDQQLSSSIDGVQLTVWPGATSPCSPADCDGTEINNASIAIAVSVPDPSTGQPVTALFPGDAELRAQRRFAQFAEHTGPFDVVATAHHGSATQLPQLYATAQARVHLVSVGAANDYGHPADSTLQMLQATGGAIYRTDQHGLITITGGDVRTTRTP